MTMRQFIEEPCEVKVSSTVLKTSGYREVFAEFNPYLPTPRLITRVKLGTGRNQSAHQIGTLALTGGYYGELNVCCT